MRKFIKRWGRGPRGENPFVAAFFDAGGVLCAQCDTVTEAEGLSPLTCVACPACGGTLFVPLRIKDFLLVEPAGAGGIASVYKAFLRHSPGELFAVKVLKEEHRSDQETVDAFLTEARIHGRVPDHPNLVGYVDSGCEADRYFYVMEYVTGEPLLSRVEKGGRIPEPEALQILERVMDVMEHIARQGFLYRDVNARNVVMSAEGEHVVLDFGLTLPLEVTRRPQGRVKHVVGTPEFLPPERLYGTGEDERSTVYSLGLLLYLMLTGTMMMKAKSVKSMAHKHVARLRVAHASMPEDVSEAAMDLLEHMVAQEAKDRYASFHEAHEAIRAVQETGR